MPAVARPRWKSLTRPHLVTAEGERYLRDQRLRNPNPPKWQQDISAILLGLAGDHVTFPSFEEDFKPIMSRGKPMPGRGSQFVRMQPNQCHRNASVFFQNAEEVEPGRFQIATGYALTWHDNGTGIWVQHTWLWDTKFDRVIETTQKRACYFGFILDAEETDKFCHENE